MTFHAVIDRKKCDDVTTVSHLLLCGISIQDDCIVRRVHRIEEKERKKETESSRGRIILISTILSCHIDK